MGFSGYETSVRLGQPVELYEFRYGDDPAEVIRMTSADENITVGIDTYLAVPLERDSFTDDGNPDDGNALNLTLPRNNALADLYRISPPDKAVTVKIKAMHRNDPDQQLTAVWSGRIVGVSWEFPRMKVGCERISTSLKRTGLRARYQRQCRHVHYGSGCRLDRASYETAGTVDAIVGKTVLTIAPAAGFANGYFNGGIVEHNGQLRLIVGHTGDTVSINRPLNDLSIGDTIHIYPGCDRSASTCAAKFNNLPNYGGFDFIPGKGPFEGSSLV